MITYDFDHVVDRVDTCSIKYDLRQTVFGKADVIPMWVADMDFETPDFIREAVIDRAKHPIYGYTFRDFEYYLAIADWLLLHHGWMVKKEDIIFCPGVVPALNLAVLSFTKPGDKIIIQPPVYPPFINAVKDHNRELVSNQLVKEDGKYYIDFDLLESQARGAALLILCNPHNPVGRCWTKDELEKIADICLKNNVLVVSDEIHADIVLPGFHHQVFANISPEVADITITAHAPSKTFNLAGLSTSSIIISNQVLREIFTAYLNKRHLGMGNLFGFVASTAAYRHGDEWRMQLLKYLNNNIEITQDYLAKQITGIKMILPEATYMIWLDFSNYHLDDNSLKNKIIHEAGLGFNPGSDFGPGGEGFMRMNIACTKATLHMALNKLSAVF